MSYEMFSSVLSLLTYAQYDRTRKEKNQNSNTHCCNYCDRNSRWYIFETRHCRTKYNEFQRIYNGKYGAEVKEESKFQSPSIRFLPTHIGKKSLPGFPTPIDTCLTRDPDFSPLGTRSEVVIGGKNYKFQNPKTTFFRVLVFSFFRTYETTKSRKYGISLSYKHGEKRRDLPTNTDKCLNRDPDVFLLGTRGFSCRG